MKTVVTPVKYTATSMNIHDVASVELQSIEPLESGGSASFTRKVAVRTAGGMTFRLTLFAEQAESLNLEA